MPKRSKYKYACMSPTHRGPPKLKKRFHRKCRFLIDTETGKSVFSHIRRFHTLPVEDIPWSTPKKKRPNPKERK